MSELDVEPPPVAEADPSLRGRLAALGVVALACLVLAVVALARLDGDAVAVAADPPDPPDGMVMAPGQLLYRSTELDATHGQVLAVPADTPGAAPTPTGLVCERVHASRVGGLCLTADRGVLTTYRATVFGPDARSRHDLPLAGIPSRARVSPDGRLAASTTFVSGHSYADGAFSTSTIVYRLDDGSSVANLEDFTIDWDGRVYRSVDVNFWGVTFVPDTDRFYATMATRGRHHLVEGDVSDRTVLVLADDVECPSLSPDGARVAYKHRLRVDGAIEWRIHVLDLATGRDSRLPEERTVDDQIEWLDDDRVLYGLPRRAPSAATDVWVLDVDAGSDPELFLPGAWSPAVIR